MRIDTENWEDFTLEKLFELRGGFYNKKPRHSAGEGDIPFLAATDSDNGVTEYYTLDDIKSWDKVGEEDSSLEGKIYPGNCVAVTVDGSVCNAFYQEGEFTCSHSITAMYARNFEMDFFLAIFFCTVITNEKYRWSYGRKPHDVKKFGKSVIKLPILRDGGGSPRTDGEKKFSASGYVPDFDYMREYVRTLHHKPVTTTVKERERVAPDTAEWKEFYLHRVFDVSMGNNVDAVDTSATDPKFAYVTRNSNDNGVVGHIDEIEGVDAFPPGTMTLALGGSYLGSCFLQNEPFYTAQNVGILKEKIPMSDCAKLFIATLVTNECRMKYVAFARELNAHFRKDFVIKLPVQRAGGEFVIDGSKKFSDEGYVPDWEYMDDYMKHLPYSDRIG